MTDNEKSLYHCIIGLIFILIGSNLCYHSHTNIGWFLIGIGLWI